MPDLFPRGIAYGDAFYDRDMERGQLKQAIDVGHHTVLIAPRRYGKTSLIRKVVSENNYPYVWVDLMTFTSREEAEEGILSQCAQLIIQIGGSEDKIKVLVKKFLAFMQPELSVNIHSVVNLAFRPDFKNRENLVNTLIAVDQIAQHMQKRAVIVFDEFQEILSIDERNAFQGSIRHAAELAQSLTYLFSGSRHTALRTLFTGKKNPLYELCDLMLLKRISGAYYSQYLQEKARERWGHELGAEVIEKILRYTECYPKYVNALCGKIWVNPLEPTAELVEVLWEDFVFSRKDDTHTELDGLKMNERKLLRWMCANPTDQPYSMEYAMKAGLSPTSLRRALEEGLIKKEIVIQDSDTGVFYVIDPVLKSYLKMY